jgi:hypothetical protein
LEHIPLTTYTSSSVSFSYRIKLQDGEGNFKGDPNCFIQFENFCDTNEYELKIEQVNSVSFLQDKNNIDLRWWKGNFLNGESSLKDRHRFEYYARDKKTKKITRNNEFNANGCEFDLFSETYLRKGKTIGLGVKIVLQKKDFLGGEEETIIKDSDIAQSRAQILEYQPKINKELNFNNLNLKTLSSFVGKLNEVYAKNPPTHKNDKNPSAIKTTTNNKPTFFWILLNNSSLEYEKFGSSSGQSDLMRKLVRDELFKVLNNKEFKEQRHTVRLNGFSSEIHPNSQTFDTNSKKFPKSLFKNVKKRGDYTYTSLLDVLNELLEGKKNTISELKSKSLNDRAFESQTLKIIFITIFNQSFVKEHFIENKKFKALDLNTIEIFTRDLKKIGNKEADYFFSEYFKDNSSARYKKVYWDKRSNSNLDLLRENLNKAMTSLIYQ